jgi:hypothetical protein
VFSSPVFFTPLRSAPLLSSTHLHKHSTSVSHHSPEHNPLQHNTVQGHTIQYRTNTTPGVGDKGAQDSDKRCCGGPDPAASSIGVQCHKLQWIHVEVVGGSSTGALCYLLSAICTACQLMCLMLPSACQSCQPGMHRSSAPSTCTCLHSPALGPSLAVCDAATTRRLGTTSVHCCVTTTDLTAPLLLHHHYCYCYCFSSPPLNLCC